jgi:hypothetical protein
MSLVALKVINEHLIRDLLNYEAGLSSSWEFGVNHFLLQINA